MTYQPEPYPQGFQPGQPQPGQPQYAQAGQHAQPPYPPYEQPYQPQPGQPQFGQPQPGQPKAPSSYVMPLKILALVLVLVGLAIPFDDTMSYVTQIAWSVFAVVAALTQVIGGPGTGPDAERKWRTGMIGVGALTLHWLLVVLPNVTSNEGFVLTLALAAAWGAAWLSPARNWR